MKSALPILSVVLGLCAPIASADVIVPTPSQGPGSAKVSQVKGKTYTKAEAIKIVKEAEDIRGVDRNESTVTLTTIESKRKTVYEMNIQRAPERKAFVNFLSPDEERGRRMLAVGNSYWSRFPDSKKVHAISRREMIGNSAFALADLFQIDAEKDYDPTIIGEETIDKIDTLKVELISKHDETQYAKILYNVQKSDYFPVRAEFFGVSGKHLKTMTIVSRTKLAGRLRPKELRMVELARKGHTSVWLTNTMEIKDIPDFIFTKEYLAKR